MVGRPEAEKSGLLNCRMSHNFNVSSPDRGMRKKKKTKWIVQKALPPSLEFATLNVLTIRRKIKGKGGKEGGKEM